MAAPRFPCSPSEASAEGSVVSIDCGFPIPRRSFLQAGAALAAASCLPAAVSSASDVDEHRLLALPGRTPLLGHVVDPGQAFALHDAPKAMPEISFENGDGETRTFADFRGKVVAARFP